MGSSRPRNSTRDRRGRSDRTSPKPPRKPPAGRRARRKPPNLGEAGNSLPKLLDGAASAALREVHRKLEIAGTVAYVCAATLRAQMTGYDTDVALCLQRCVGDEIDRQIQQIDGLLERERSFHDDGREDSI